MSGLVLPALIVKAPFAAALCEGVQHHDGSAKRFYKTVECRGPRAALQLQRYRGAVAIFVSASYDRADTDHLAWWYARQVSTRRPVKLSVDVATHVHAYCAMVASAVSRMISPPMYGVMAELQLDRVKKSNPSLSV